MIAVDANVLAYAHKQQSPFHEKAKRALVDLAGSSATWAIPWPCAHEFYSMVTNPRIYRPPSSAEQAVAQLESWWSAPSLVMLSEAHNHGELLSRLLERTMVTGSAVHDARIAAICLSHGVRELLTMDRDFSRFPELTTRSLLTHE
jgi:toxin-antitoxin system PIN domain toxin